MAVTLPHEKVKQEPVVGIFIMFIIATFAFALFLGDPMVLLFGVMIIGVWVLASSVGTGDAKTDLEAIGITGKDITIAIPVGIAIGVISLLIGSVIMGLDNQANFMALSSIIIPSVATSAALGTATVIPHYLANTVEVFSQWLYVAPGEEAGFRVLTVFGLQSIFANPIIAFFGATLIWAAMHIPLWMSTGVSGTMYIVIVVWGVIWSAQFVIMRNFFSNVISHATTNTGVIVLKDAEMTGGVSTYTYALLALITVVLIALGWWYRENTA